MIESQAKVDGFDLKILAALQKDSNLSQRELAEKVGCRKMPAGAVSSGFTRSE